MVSGGQINCQQKDYLPGPEKVETGSSNDFERWGMEMKFLKQVKNGLIVSAQALEGEPLHGPMLMAAVARAAALGGAAAIRTNGTVEVEVIKKLQGYRL